MTLSAIMLIDVNIYNPRLPSHTVEVHPLIVFAAIIAGNTIGGLVGKLIVLPCAAFAKLRLVRCLMRRYSHRSSVGERT